MSHLGNIEDTLLLFGGPYSNLAATRAMRAWADELGIAPQRVICTGDVIAYCGEPCETLELVRDWGIHLVMGNCEESLAFGENDCGCGFEPGSECSVLAVTWYDFANRRVTAAQRSWMRELPRAVEFYMRGRRFGVTHASLNSINEFVFASSEASIRLEQMRAADLDVVVGGHSGIPFGQRLEDRYWLNSGVIGMPANDGGNHGWYLLLRPESGDIEASWHRLDYDYQASRVSTIAAGMPAYGEALANGLWPSIDILPESEARQTGKTLELPPMRIASGNRAFASSAEVA